MNATLAAVEEHLKETKTHYQSNEFGLEVLFAGHFEGLIYPILISEGKGCAVATLWFSRPAAPRIHNVAEFCEKVNECLAEEAEIGFNMERRSFYAGKIIDPDCARTDLETFSGICDLLFPLCKQVGELGKWDERLIWLAFVAPESMSYV
jgi:hypothetical protein